MQSGNPALHRNVFVPVPGWEALDRAQQRSTVMTVQGTALKSGVLLLVCAIAAVISYGQASASGALAMPMLVGGLIGGLVLGLIISFRAKTAPFLAIPFAVCEGLFVGVISLFVAERVARSGAAGAATTQSAISAALAGGIIFQAVLLTFGIFAGMLILYATRVLRATPLFTKMVIVGTAGVAVTYLATIVLGLFGMQIPYIHSSGPIGIGFSVVVVGLAAFNLVLDFDFIEQNAQRGAPKYLEWYGAYGLLVTLVWLYIEILRLLAKLNRRD